MITKGIRGAISVEENTPEAIGAATIKLLQEIKKRNKFEKLYILLILLKYIFIRIREISCS